jgi:hypothetical protein
MVDHRCLCAFPVGGWADERGVEAEHFAQLQLGFPFPQLLMICDPVPNIRGFADVQESFEVNGLGVGIIDACIDAVDAGLCPAYRWQLRSSDHA